MSTNTRKANTSKWLNASVAITCVILLFLCIRFFKVIGEWFELEVQFGSYTVVSQAASVLIALASFIYIQKNQKVSTFLKDSFTEVIKVVFPDRNETLSMTWKVMILVTICGFLLGVFDYASTWFLSLLPGWFLG